VPSFPLLLQHVSACEVFSGERLLCSDIRLFAVLWIRNLQILSNLDFEIAV
jgi:hypothetical protein